MSAPESTQDAQQAAFELYPEIEQMFGEFPKYPPVILPSKYWEELNRKNLQQLAEAGYENFKQTLARNYFTWIVNPWNKQMRFLMAEAGLWRSVGFFWQALRSPRHEHFKKKKHSVYYDLLTNLLWSYVAKHDTQGLLGKLTEPEEGHPPRIMRDGRLISQDLANSVLEYGVVAESGVDTKQVGTIMELGPGYGRTAYVWLSMLPTCRYVLVDIPPALYVAQRYLTAVFPERRIFAFRPFDDFESVRADFNDASIVFLTPNQLELLPDKSIDLFINISSLHEMRLDQIRYYFGQIERLTRKYFYYKQWKETTVPFENETIREADYPVPEDWKLLLRQQCAVQHKFFEAVYELPEPQ